MKLTEIGNFEEALKAIPIEFRGKTLKRAVTASGRPVVDAAKAKCPPPGYDGDKQGLKPLRDTIRMEVRDYGLVWIAIVGPEYPAGAHGHLVEFGHAEVLWGKVTGRRVPPKPFLRPAAAETEDKQKSEFERVIKEDVAKIIPTVT